jgi:hypothetical protein
MAPASRRNPRGGYQSARAIRPRGESPGLHKCSAEGWGNGVERRSFTLARTRVDTSGKSSQKKKLSTVCLSNDALRRDVESGRCATRSAQCCERDRRQMTGTTGLACAPLPSLAEQQTIEDGLRAHTRILCAAVERRHLTLILVRVINTSISTLASSNRLPPGYLCAIHWVLAATRFDTLDPMPLLFFYNCHDSLFALVCAEVHHTNFSHPRSRFRRTCSHSLSWSSAAGTESAARISITCRKVATRPQ